MSPVTRPYVRRITNNRQILFDCDRGYKLKLGGFRGSSPVNCTNLCVIDNLQLIPSNLTNLPRVRILTFFPDGPEPITGINNVVVSPGAPMGATCLDGQWSPSEIPSCHQMQHPNIKWVAALQT